MRRETEGTPHFSAGIAATLAGISPAVPPTLFSEITLSRL